jgi:hypothetical protein
MIFGAMMLAYAPAHKKLRVSQIREKAELCGVEMQRAISMRINYLYQYRSQLTRQIQMLNELYPPEISTAYLLADAAIRLIQHRSEIEHEIKTMRRWNQPVPAGNITDDMIATAKAYPIEQLVEFDRAGKAMAWCHPDKAPSLSWHKKANRAHCFPCGKSFNPIDVLIARDGMNFISAVKYLYSLC